MKVLYSNTPQNIVTINISLCYVRFIDLTERQKKVIDIIGFLMQTYSILSILKAFITFRIHCPGIKTVETLTIDSVVFVCMLSTS